MTAHLAARKALLGFSYADDVALVRKSIAVLAYCAEQDNCAQIFHDSLQDSLSPLEEYRSPVEGSAIVSSASEPSIHYVLYSSRVEMTSLDYAAQDLLRVICRPLENLPSMSTKASFANQAEMIMGTHLEWEWELKNSDQLSHTTLQEPTKRSAAPEAAAIFTHSSTPPHRTPWTTFTPPAHLGS